MIAWSDERTGAQTPSVYAQHLLADGSIAPGWVQDGIPVATGPGAHGGTQLISDGSGGAFLAWGDTRNGTADIYAQRLTASGQPASGWVANGNPVCIAPGDQILPVPVPDGGGGFFVAWFDNRTGAPPYAAGDIYCQRMTGDGQIVSGWPATGVPVAATPQVQQAQVMAPDGLGGALIAWEDYRNGISEVFAQRILASGAVAPGWPVNGRPVSTTTYNTLEPRIVGDGQGGVYITYRQMETASDVVPVQHLTASGAVAAGWPSDGFRVVNGSGDQADHDITSDGAGGAIVAFEDGATGKIYAERFAAYGPVPVAVSFENVTATAEEVQLTWQVGIGSLSQTTVERRTESGTWQPLGAALESGNGRLTFTDRQIVPGARYGYRLSWMDSGQLVHGGETWVDVPRAELALEGLRPNPAAADLNVAFSLPSSVPATLELLDVSGRRVVSQEVGSLGAGRHLVQLREGGSVAAGLYWLRLQQGGRSLTARAVVVR